MEALKERFAHLGLRYSIGGQISFDVFPEVTSRFLASQNSCVWDFVALKSVVLLSEVHTGHVQGILITLCLNG